MQWRRREKARDREAAEGAAEDPRRRNRERGRKSERDEAVGRFFVVNHRG